MYRRRNNYREILVKPILHHYPPSLFSEKVRALFGYLDMDWQSVIIPPIMPRPHLMPLTGGYRKTPVMQIGAHVYCDTAIICRTLAARAGDDTLYRHGFAADQVARWADTELFRTTVALNFSPEAVAGQMSQMSAADMEAFAKDRAELSGGAPMVATAPDAARAQFQGDLARLDASLTEPFLFGDAPTIADFSVYHCLWFIDGNPANRSMLDGWPNVRDYITRMAAYGHGNSTELTPEAALEIGTTSTPALDFPAVVDPRFAGSHKAGDSVSVSANDYGRNPLNGRLMHWSATEIIIERKDAQAGQIMLHVPNVGFEVAAA